MVEKIKEKKVVITGSGGMLGSDLSRVFPRAIRLTHKQFDITDREQVFLKISELKPDVVINAAAYTNVERAEDEKEAANFLNSTAVLYLAEACKKTGSILLHYSTDYVFDGGKKTGYDESDKPNPLNAYGRSKLGGEQNIQNTMEKYYLLRTSWLFGKNGKNFVDTITRIAKENGEIRVVDDQFGCPTFSYDLALMTKKIVDGEYPFGIYHVTNGGYCSWFKFAQEIVSAQKIKCRVLPCASKEYPTKVVRPRYSILNNNKTEKMPEWQNALRRYLSLKM